MECPTAELKPDEFFESFVNGFSDEGCEDQPDLAEICFLEVLQGNSPGEIFRLPPEGEVIIGRHSKCLVRIIDPEISRHQARITKLDNQWIIENLSKSGYTIVEGEDIRRPTRLEDKNKILLGSTILEFQKPNH